MEVSWQNPTFQRGHKEPQSNGGVSICLRLSTFARVCLRLFALSPLRLLVCVDVCLHFLVSAAILCSSPPMLPRLSVPPIFDFGQPNSRSAKVGKSAAFLDHAPVQLGLSGRNSRKVLGNGRNTVSRVLFRRRELTEFYGKLGEFCEKLGEFALMHK